MRRVVNSFVQAPDGDASSGAPNEISKVAEQACSVTKSHTPLGNGSKVLSLMAEDSHHQFA